MSDLLRRLRFEGDNSDHCDAARRLFHDAADEIDKLRGRSPLDHPALREWLDQYMLNVLRKVHEALRDG